MPQQIGKPPVISINWRKLVLFSLVFVVVFVGWKIFSRQIYTADQPSATALIGTSTNAKVEIEIKENGDVFENGKQINARVNPQKDFDELRLVVFDKNGFYINNLIVTVKLPDDIAYSTSQEILAIHGVGDSSYSKTNNKTLEYRATSVTETATITIVAKLPKGTIKYPIYDRTVFFLSQKGSAVWFILAIALPTFTLIYLFGLLIFSQSTQKVTIPKRSIDAPPAELPPAVLGVLLNQKVGAREIAATLIDLADKKVIYIIDRDRGFSFGKRHLRQQMFYFEKILLSKIFRRSLKSTEEELDQRFAEHLYSHKMSLFSKEVYNIASQLGYFKQDPSGMHRRYQFFGGLLFFFALGCFFLTFKYFPTLPYAVFFWVGMMVASIVIILVGSNLPIRTPAGLAVLSNWLAFKNYLSDPDELPKDQQDYEKFARYLPYAIVFQVEALWARRFSKQEFVLPDWFLTEKSGIGLRDFCLSLFPIVGYVGQNLSEIREPGYK